jgi:D-erythro-7,8-dihydroneopterin triphosphate epimerase
VKELTVRIKDLRLRGRIGITPDEQSKEQDLVVTARFSYDGEAAIAGDNVAAAVDYKTIKLRLIEEVGGNPHALLETLADRLLGILMDDPRVLEATVEVDKPHALRFADSVSVERRAVRQ